jgi:flagellar motility protein MotE (MotC chaperone)
MARLRLIPTTMTVAMLFTGIKVIDIARGSQSMSDNLLIASVQAEASGEAPKQLPKKEDAAEKKSDPKAEAKDIKTDAKKDGKEAAKPEGEHAAEGEHGEAKKADDKEPSNVSETPGITIDDHLSATQVELLQKLADRRDELDRWEKDIQLKETVLQATEKKLNEKIAQIEAMKIEVSGMLTQYNEKEDGKIRSLVKIYENMKPKDAARIFDEVEMPVLLMVIDKMAEKKVAPILAEMDPKKAKQVTVEFAEQRKVDAARLGNINAMQGQQAAPADATKP